MKLKTIIFLGIFSAIGLPGCDYLDKMPDDQKTMDMVWSNRKETEAYLYSVYSQLPDEANCWDQCPWSGASDEADMIWDRYVSAKLNKGDWNPTSNHYNKWDGYYRAIRASFVFENNVDKCPELTETLKTQYRAEVKFLRGYFYWKLLQQYGPFVLIESETEIADDWNKYPRTPYDQCVTYICRMLDEAEVDLPWTWNNDNAWLGKPNKLVCKAVKAEVLTMAASPQWNGNAEYADFKNQDGTPLVNTSYDEQKWKDAAAASKAVINAAETMPDLNIKLYKNNENGDAIFSPFISVRDAMLKKWNCEVIWARTGTDPNGYEKHATPRPGGWCGIAPTQRLVDAFYMVNGRTIDDPKSNYIEEGFAANDHQSWTKDEIAAIATGESWGHRKGEWNMYANREARFYMSILYNGRPIPQVDKNDRNSYSSDKNKNGWGRVELYGNGVAGFNGNADHSATGYLVVKRINPNSNPYKGTHAEWRPYAYIRLARVYLDYIEALNEYDPTNPDIKKYWDMIRERAGLPSIFETYPEIKGKKEGQLEYILRERQIELCFEGDRYFTTRRRWIAHKTDTKHDETRRMFGDGGPMYGMNVAAGDDFSSTDFYRRSKFEDRVFDKKMYLFPINQSEMDRNSSMVQNPWW